MKLSLPSEDLLDNYEKKIGMSFPNEYRKFLKDASNVFVGNLSPFVVTGDPNTRGELFVALQEARNLGLPKNLLPICEDNGDYYCLLQDGSVRFWSHECALSESWPDLASWIKEVWIGGR